MITRWLSALLFAALMFAGVGVKSLAVAYVALAGFVVASTGIFFAVIRKRSA